MNPLWHPGALTMRTALLLAALTLTTFTLAVIPSASAGHCAPYPLAQEATCMAGHVVDGALCYYYTAPSNWLGDCVGIAITDTLP